MSPGGTSVLQVWKAHMDCQQIALCHTDKKRYAQCVMLNKEYRFLTNNFRFLLINNRKFIQNVENAQKTQDILTLSCLL